MLRYIGPATLGSGRRSSSKDSGGAGVGMAIMLLGVTLMICGFIGTFFGRLVQAAVSRQREFLADASAVQYTRNPDGIGGALRKIKLMIRPDETELPKKAADISHMFFTKAIDSIFATHPPLPERIARVEGLDIDDVERQLKEQKHRQPPPLRGQPAAAQPSMPAMHVDPANVVQGAILAAVLQDSIAHVGEVTPQQLSEARRIIDSIPAPLQEAAHSMASARMVVLCLLRDEDEADQQLQENYLREALDPMSFQQWHGLVPLMADVPPGSRLPLLDLCIPSLSQMSEEQYGQFRDLMNRMIKIDGQIDRWEWVVDTVIDRHLEERYHKPGAERKANMKLDRAIDAGTMVMATLACTGAQAEEQAQAAFAAGLSHLGWQRTLPDPRSLSLGVLREALRQLRKVRFADRGRFLEACGMCVLHDGITTVEESETLRAVAESIDCPMPLIVSQG